jgi:CSLREA domain-containing protein
MRTTVLCVGLAVLLACLLAAKPAHAATNFTVNSTGDQSDAALVDDPNVCDTDLSSPRNQCTLRAAIEEANDTDGADTINFSIDPGSAPGCDSTSKVCTISLDLTTSPIKLLPPITDPLRIDGYSQGKTTADPADDAKPATSTSNAALKIELSGNPSVALAYGLKITAANSTVKGLVFNAWGAGVLIDGSGATGNRIQGNFIGTDASGTQDLPSGDGVSIQDAPNNTVGGTKVGARNLISANNGDGVVIAGTGAEFNKVMGNYIGTKANGTKPLGNSNGVVIESAPNNTVGGTEAGARNVISGNGGGVWIENSGAEGNKVQGNYIGTTTSGTKDLGNHNAVFITDASNNTVGGTDADDGTVDGVVKARNIISGNFNDGVAIGSFGGGGAAEGNKVMGNYIGTDASGTQDLGNSRSGVLIFMPINTIAIVNTTTVTANTIAFNGQDGVQVTAGIENNTGNRILSNSIHSNAGLGIDLLGPGETSVSDVKTDNDAKDPDEGPNNLQNKPRITSAKPTTIGENKFTTIKGTLNSTPGQTFTIQLFRNRPGEDEGRTLLRQLPSITTDADGRAIFGTRVNRSAAPVGFAITATATNNSSRDTSEFSTPCTVLDLRCPP